MICADNYLKINDFLTFKKKSSLFAMTAHIIYSKIDKINTATHSKKIIQLIRKYIKFKNLIMSDDISMKSLKGSISWAGCQNNSIDVNFHLQKFWKVSIKNTCR